MAACGETDTVSRLCKVRSSQSQIGDFVLIPKGQFIKSDTAVYPEEGIHYSVIVEAFFIQAHEVTNSQFSEFVSQTNYVTDAEIKRSLPEGNGSAVFPHTATDQEPAWRLDADANWSAPYGKGGQTLNRQSYPVVHVSLRDARAYADWAGGRLPTELEWEYAAQLGLPNPKRADSGAYDSESTPIANTWQGVFPFVNSAQDGFHGVSPVACYPPSKIGLYDMIGNVWEWTDTPVSNSSHLIKGGSFLCASNFCKRYRPTARQAQEIDFSTNHIGFRIVKSAWGQNSETNGQLDISSNSTFHTDKGKEYFAEKVRKKLTKSCTKFRHNN